MLLSLATMVALVAATASAFAPTAPKSASRTRPRPPARSVFRQSRRALYDEIFSQQPEEPESGGDDHDGRWCSGVDPDSGRVYWYNEATGESRWDGEGGGEAQGEAGDAQQGQQTYVVANYIYNVPNPDAGQLSFRAGDVIQVTQQGEPDGWWEGALNGQVGWFPSNFCVPYYDAAQSTQQADSDMYVRTWGGVKRYYTPKKRRT